MDFKNGGSSERRPPLAREGSIYSLTFYELQSTLGSSGSGVGKDFGSMHMDELLRSIWTAEESQAMASASASASGASGHGATQLQRQGSLTLPRTISAKTVDEVWRNLVRDAPEGATPAPMGVAASPEPQTRRQATLGEMTLEEFLVRAGVVRENPVAEAPVPPPPVPAPNSTIFYGNFASANNTGAGTVGFTSLGIGEPIMRSGLVPGVAGMGSGAVEAAVRAQLDSAGKANNDLPSPIAPVPYSFEGMMRGRRSGGGMEKVVERRQRRMIKNRESAARSRARKQAYTMELEAEVQKLKEQNRELQRKQAEIMQLQKNQVLETIKDPSGRKKRSLQRTLTGPW